MHPLLLLQGVPLAELVGLDLVHPHLLRLLHQALLDLPLVLQHLLLWMLQYSWLFKKNNKVLIITPGFLKDNVLYLEVVMAAKGT